MPAYISPVAGHNQLCRDKRSVPILLGAQSEKKVADVGMARKYDKSTFSPTNDE